MPEPDANPVRCIPRVALGVVQHLAGRHLHEADVGI